MRLPGCCCLLLLLVAGIRGQDDFDLGDAIEDNPVAPTTKPKPDPGSNTVGSVDVPTKKPTPKPAGNDEGGDGFDLGDAINHDDTPSKPTVKPKPQPGQGGGGGGDFGDSDLGDGNLDSHDGHEDRPGGHDRPSGEGQGQEGQQQSVVAGIVSAVAVAAVGAVSSFIAYQKKKLCFKGATDDPENVNMESHKVDQSDPQAQSSLLAK